MTGTRIIETNFPHECAVKDGTWASWPGSNERAWPGSVWRCDRCGAYWKVVNTAWRQHLPGPFKLRKYRKVQEAK